MNILSVLGCADTDGVWQGVAVETPAARFIAETVLASPGEVTILALGPLTNLALAMQYDAKVADAMVSYLTWPAISQSVSPDQCSMVW